MAPGLRIADAWSQTSGLANTDGAGECDDLHPAGAGLTECGGRGVGRRPGRVHVVGEDDRSLSAAPGGECAAHISPPADVVEPSLPTRRAGARQERLDRDVPAAAELVCQCLGGMMPSSKTPVAVGRDECEPVGIRPRDDCNHEVDGPRGKPPKPPFLPRRHDPTDGVVVGHSRACLRERQPPSVAFAAARDGPCRRTAAACTHRPGEPPQSFGARGADLRPVTRARETTLRQ